AFGGSPRAADGDAIAFEAIEMADVVATHTARESSGFQLGPLDFSLRRGETIFIVGANGSGKTTFLSVLTGLLDPVEGSLKVNGETLAIERMEQYRALFSTVFTDFHLFRKLYGLRHVDTALADEVLARVHLADMTGVRDGEFTRIDLSAGQKRRLALAIAIFES